MVDRVALQRLREQQRFEDWVRFVDAGAVAASEESIRRLIDELLSLGLHPTEDAARRAVAACVRRFNALDEGWICTIEREDICGEIERIVEACGFECQDDWLEDRDW